MDQYTSIKEFERMLRADKKRALKQTLLDMVAGAGLMTMLYVFTVVFLSL